MTRQQPIPGGNPSHDELHRRLLASWDCQARNMPYTNEEGQFEDPAHAWNRYRRLHVARAHKTELGESGHRVDDLQPIALALGGRIR